MENTKLQLEELLREVREASFGEMDHGDLREAIRAALKAKIAAENGSEDCACYAYVDDVFQTFIVTAEEDRETYRTRHYKRSYSVSGTTVTVGDRAGEVELAWVQKLREAVDARGAEATIPGVNSEPKCKGCESSLVGGEVEDGSCLGCKESVATGAITPSQEAIDCTASEMRASEATLAFSEASFSQTGVVEGVIPIQPGLSVNRRYYPAKVIQRDMQVFENMPVFYDHQDPSQPKPLRNLVGVLKNVRWDESKAVPRADLHYSKSMETTIAEIKDKFDLLGADRVGLSIDMNVKAKVANHGGKIVHSVEALVGGNDASTDVVFMPAAGGRVWESIQPDGELMSLEKMTIEELKAARPDLVAALEAEKPAAKVELLEPLTLKVGEAVKPAVDVQAEIQKATESLRTEFARETRKATVASKVAGLQVPEKFRESILRECEAADFDVAASESVIAEWCNLAAANAGGAKVNVPGGVAKVTESIDVAKARLEGAVLGEDQEINGRKVRRYHSLREAILAFQPEMIHDVVHNPGNFAREAINLLHWGGGDLGQRVSESINSASFSNAWADVMNRSLLREVADPDLNTWRQWVSDIVPFSDLTNSKKLVQIGEYTEFPTVLEDGTYQAVNTPGEQKVEMTILKKGGTESFTWEAALRDDMGALARIPRALGRAWAWTIYRFIYGVLQGTGVGPTMDYDATALYDAAHANILSTPFTSADLITLEQKIRDQKALSSGYPKKYRARFLLYQNDAALRQNIWEALNSSFKVNPLSTSGSQVNLPNMIQAMFGLDPVEVDYPVATSTRWELVADPRDVATMAVGFLNGREEPEIFVQDMERVGSVFSNDRITYKLRGTIGAEAVDHKSFARGNA